MTNAINFIDGLDGLAAGHRGHRRGHVLPLHDAAARPRHPHRRQHRPADRGDRRSACASASCPSTSTRPGSSWATAARCSSGCSWPRPPWWSAAGSTRACSSAARPTSSSPRCSSRSFILGVPIFDTFLAIVRRAAKRKAPSGADKEHIHHRLVRLGHGHRRSVLILWAWTALLSVLVLYPTYSDGKGNALVPGGHRRAVPGPLHRAAPGGALDPRRPPGRDRGRCGAGGRRQGRPVADGGGPNGPGERPPRDAGRGAGLVRRPGPSRARRGRPSRPNPERRKPGRGHPRAKLQHGPWGNLRPREDAD